MSVRDSDNFAKYAPSTQANLLAREARQQRVAEKRRQQDALVAQATAVRDKALAKYPADGLPVSHATTNRNAIELAYQQACLRIRGIQPPPEVSEFALYEPHFRPNVPAASPVEIMQAELARKAPAAPTKSQAIRIPIAAKSVSAPPRPTSAWKSFPALSTKAVEGAPAGTLEALVSVTGNEDLGGDVVMPGAFQSFINQVKAGSKRYPTLMYNHAVELGLAAVMGKVTDLEELQPGDYRMPAKLQGSGLGALKIRAQFNLKTSAGRDGYEHVLAGDVGQFSFMYFIGDSEIDPKGRRLLKAFSDIPECSVVLVGMNPLTQVLDVKRSSRDAMIQAAGRRLAAEIAPAVIAEAFRRARRELGL